jgi:hypothetical protein
VKSADPDGVASFITTSAQIGDRQRPIISALSTRLCLRFDDFVVGRQLFTIATVVALALVINKLRLTPDTPAVNLAPPALFSFLSTLVNHRITTFLVSTLMPCWIAQLLPQFLADRRGIEFLQLWPSRVITEISLLICRVGAGKPASWIHRFLSRTGRFSGVEKIPIGARSLFEEVAKYYGTYVDNWTITISVEQDRVVVAEAIKYVFESGATSDIRHIVKAAGVIDKLTYEIQPPSGVASAEPSLKQIGIYLGETKPGDTNPTIFQGEVNCLIELPLETSIPRSPIQADEATVITTYETGAIDAGIGLKDGVYIDIIKPTRELVVIFKADDSMIVREPNVDLFLRDESIITSTQPIEQGRIKRLQRQRQWEVTASYPPVGTRCVLDFEVLAQRQVRTAHGR